MSGAVEAQGAFWKAMSYPPRIELPNRHYHVFANGVDGCKIYRDDDDRQSFLASFEHELMRSEWTCLAYSLLSTHFHVLIRLENCTLSSGFQHLNGTYARDFNRKHGRRGALWRRRFKSVLIGSDEHLLEMNRYIAWNAPNAGLCKRPEDYVWCSYGAAVGACPSDPLIDENELLGLFAVDPKKARRHLREFVEEKDPRRRRSQTLLRDASETVRLRNAAAAA
jgi:putative transposase